MGIRCEATVPFPRPLVWTTYRDRLVDLLPHLPNIRGIEPLHRSEEGTTVRMQNVWRGGGDIPAVARAVISEKMLSWTDYAAWDERSWECAWRVVPHSFSEGVDSQGVNRYIDVGGATRLEITGHLTIDGTKIRGVPKLLAPTISRAVEEFMVKLVSKNLSDVSSSLARFLEEDAKRARC